MERNNGRYPYIRRQGSGGGGGGHQQQHAPHNHHHHSGPNNANSSTAATTTAPHNNTQYSNSINNAAATQQQQQQQLQQNVPLSQHDELIRYIREAWNKVSEQGTPIIYCNESDNQLKNFKPFNLEEYWGQRVVKHVTGGHQ